MKAKPLHIPIEFFEMVFYGIKINTAITAADYLGKFKYVALKSEWKKNINTPLALN